MAIQDTGILLDRLRPPALAVVLLVTGAIAFSAGSGYWARSTPEGHDLDPELRVVPPPSTALAMAFGDRYLAADLAAARAMVAGSQLEGEGEKALFARLLDLANRLNPAHEDVYYLTEAHLPWQGRVRQAQSLLKRAGRSRPWDWLPPFFRAFNLYYFRRQPMAGARILREAAARKPPKQAARLRAIAGRWTAFGQDPREALDMVESMVKGATLGALQRNLERRAEQLRRLIRLQEAAKVYREEHGRPPPRLQALVGYAGLEAVPRDPMKDGFIIDESGRVRIKSPNLDRVRTPEERNW